MKGKISISFFKFQAEGFDLYRGAMEIISANRKSGEMFQK